MLRLLGFVFALLVVLAGPGSASLSSGSSEAPVNTPKGETSRRDNIRAGTAELQRASDAPDSNDRTDAPGSLTDDDDDSGEEVVAQPENPGISASLSSSTLDALVPCDIRPSQGHDAGPEKPPRV